MKTHIASYLIGFGLLAAGLTAIAEEIKPDPLSVQAYQKLISQLSKGDDCVFSRTVNGWTIIDEQSLILYAPSRSRPYYVRLNMQSFGLKYTHAIGVYSQFDNRFCPYGGNALFIDGDRFTIAAITKLDSDTAKQLIAYSKKKKAGKENTEKENTEKGEKT